MFLKDNDLSAARVGDELYCYRPDKKSTVTGIHHDTICPIWLGNGTTCTFDGREDPNDQCPTVFWDRISFEFPKRPKRMVKKTIEVWRNLYPGNIWGDNLYSSQMEAENHVYVDKAIQVKLTGEYEIEE
jgi:hypothetical protein